MSVLAIATLMALATDPACGRADPDREFAQRLAAIAIKESGGDPLVIGVNPDASRGSGGWRGPVRHGARGCQQSARADLAGPLHRPRVDANQQRQPGPPRPDRRDGVRPVRQHARGCRPLRCRRGQRVELGAPPIQHGRHHGRRGLCGWRGASASSGSGAERKSSPARCSAAFRTPRPAMRALMGRMGACRVQRHPQPPIRPPQRAAHRP